MRLLKRPSFGRFKCKIKKPSFSIKPKLSFRQPCKKFMQSCFRFRFRSKTRKQQIQPKKPKFRLRIKTCIYVRVLKFRRNKPPCCTVRIPNPIFSCGKRRPSTHPRQSSSEETIDEVGELRSVTETGEKDRKLFPSPLTPAYVKNNSWANRSREVLGGGGGGDKIEVDDACRSFENYLMEMIVEEGKMKDLVDVEELLFCWKNLKCPVFIDLVSRFYGELCKDLFISNQQEERDEEEEEEGEIFIHHQDNSSDLVDSIKEV